MSEMRALLEWVVAKHKAVGDQWAEHERSSASVGFGVYDEEEYRRDQQRHTEAVAGFRGQQQAYDAVYAEIRRMARQTLDSAGKSADRKESQ